MILFSGLLLSYFTLPNYILFLTDLSNMVTAPFVSPFSVLIFSMFGFNFMLSDVHSVAGRSVTWFTEDSLGLCMYEGILCSVIYNISCFYL